MTMIGTPKRAIDVMDAREGALHVAAAPLGRILVADDDYSVRRALHTVLFEAGFDITEASGADEAIALAQVVHCDLALVAVCVDGRHPKEMCRALRDSCAGLPILMLTTGDGEQDHIEALEAGADDCVAKPPRMSEVMARVRALMRRSKMSQPALQATLRIGEIEVNVPRRAVYRSGKMVHLTPKEFDLLVYLMVHAGLSIPYGQLLTAVWGKEHASRVDYLRTFMRQLRKKLEDRDGTPRYLLTNNYIGYRFVDKMEVPVNPTLTL